MKAALNGIPSLSVLDGWWVEGCHEGLTGWAIGERQSLPDPVRVVLQYEPHAPSVPERGLFFARKQVGLQECVPEGTA